MFSSSFRQHILKALLGVALVAGSFSLVGPSSAVAQSLRPGRAVPLYVVSSQGKQTLRYMPRITSQSQFTAQVFEKLARDTGGGGRGGARLPRIGPSDKALDDIRKTKRQIDDGWIQRLGPWPERPTAKQ
jgi:hypothetical protein